MRLVATSGDQVLSFPLRQGSTLVGRHPGCHICIPSRSISRRHCQCYVNGQTAILRDLGTSNGTFVNGQRVERTELRDGDVISLGGFQLRFEAGEAARLGGVASHSAPPTEDIVVNAQPSYGEPMKAEAPLPEEAPPAPTDFPETPEGDETPVDNAFVPPPPAADAGPQLPQLASAVPMQPQLLVRDGRWFLRDPRTGREVEIAPKGDEAVPAVRPAGAEARRPNIRLLLAAIGGAIILIVGAAGLLIPRPPSRDQTQRFPVAEYNRLVDSAVPDVRKGDYPAALAKLERAYSRRSDLETAHLLAQFVHLRMSTGSNLDKFNWNEARNYLDSLLDIGSVSDAVKAFAKEELYRINAEQTSLSIAEQALARLREGESEEVLLDVYRALLELPKDRYASRKYEPKLVELRQRLAQFHMARARRALAERKWPDAVKSLQEAIPYTDDPAPMRKQIADCQRCATEARELEDAKQDFQQKNLESAKRRLATIQPDSPYAPEAKGVLAQIEAEERQQAAETARQRIEALRQRALDLYKRGTGHEAVKVVQDNQLQDLAYIKERVERFERLLAAGQKAEDGRDYEGALQTYEEAIAIEPDAENDYRRQVERRLQELKARFPQIAAEIANEGYRIIDTDPLAARKAFDRAMRFSPEEPKAQRGLDHLQRIASLAFNEGQRHAMAKENARARASYERAIACAKPGSELYNRIAQALAQLPKE